MEKNSGSKSGYDTSTDKFWHASMIEVFPQDSVKVKHVLAKRQVIEDTKMRLKSSEKGR